MWLQTQVPNELVTGGVTAGVVAGMMAVVKYLDRRKGNQRDRSHSSQVEATTNAIKEFKTTMSEGLGRIDQRLDKLELSHVELKSAVVGFDGKNGLRKDVADLKDGFGRELGEIKDRVSGVEDRERDRLAEERLHGGFDRRT